MTSSDYTLFSPIDEKLLDDENAVNSPKDFLEQEAWKLPLEKPPTTKLTSRNLMQIELTLTHPRDYNEMDQQCLKRVVAYYLVMPSTCFIIPVRD